MYKLCTVNVYLLWSAILKSFTRSHLYFPINNLRVFSLRLYSARQQPTAHSRQARRPGAPPSALGSGSGDAPTPPGQRAFHHTVWGSWECGRRGAGGPNETPVGHPASPAVSSFSLCLRPGGTPSSVKSLNHELKLLVGQLAGSRLLQCTWAPPLPARGPLSPRPPYWVWTLSQGHNRTGRLHSPQSGQPGWPSPAGLTQSTVAMRGPCTAWEPPSCPSCSPEPHRLALSLSQEVWAPGPLGRMLFSCDHREQRGTTGAPEAQTLLGWASRTNVLAVGARGLPRAPTRSTGGSTGTVGIS